MKNLVTELLLELAQKEEEPRDLTAQVETPERVIIEMLYNMVWNDRQILIRQIEGTLASVDHIPAFLTSIYSAYEGIQKAF